MDTDTSSEPNAAERTYSAAWLLPDHPDPARCIAIEAALRTVDGVKQACVDPLRSEVFAECATSDALDAFERELRVWSPAARADTIVVEGKLARPPSFRPLLVPTLTFVPFLIFWLLRGRLGLDDAQTAWGATLTALPPLLLLGQHRLRVPKPARARRLRTTEQIRAYIFWLTLLGGVAAVNVDSPAPIVAWGAGVLWLQDLSRGIVRWMRDRFLATVTALPTAHYEVTHLQRACNDFVLYLPALAVSAASLVILAWTFLVPGQSFEAVPLAALVTAIAVLALAAPGYWALLTWPALWRASHRAAAHGVHVRDASAFETLWQTRVCAWARCGVLTVGQPRVEEVVPVPGRTREEVLHRAALVESPSRHPVALTLQQSVPAPDFADWREISDRGVVAKAEDKHLVVGNRLLLESLKLDHSTFSHDLYRISCEGRSGILVAEDETVIGAIKLFDPLRPASVSALKQLREMGVRNVVVSGEPVEIVRIIHEQVGADDFRAGVTPASLPGLLAGLKRQSIGTVALVRTARDAQQPGAAGGVEIVLGAGSETGDVFIPEPDLLRVVELVQQARVVRNRLYGLIALGALYYAVALPLACLGLLPVLAAAALACLLEVAPLVLAGRGDTGLGGRAYPRAG
ncbi:MAG: cation-translocating P-type ATPase [Candidatus Hydrogenedentes bacterium]|nr:cation-translocating P-type ATPase [Candidatus Hydrogenedentota bacterium]